MRLVGKAIVKAIWTPLYYYKELEVKGSCVGIVDCACVTSALAQPESACMLQCLVKPLSRLGPMKVVILTPDIAKKFSSDTRH